MRLENLELVNYCPHRHLEWEFGSGLNAILGPNGAGKTSALDAVYFALTGDARGEGALEANVCDRSGPGEESYARLRFSHGGVRATVTRKLKPSSVVMEVEGGSEPVRGARKVNALVEQVLGLSRRMLSDFIFVRQREVAALLSMQPAERAAALQRLFGTQHAEKCWHETGEALRALVIPTPAVDVTSVRKRLGESRARLADLEARLADITLPDDWTPAGDPDAQLIEAFKRADRLDQEVSAENLICDTLERDYEIARREAGKAQEEVTTLEGRMTAIGVESIHNDLYAWKVLKAAEEAARRWQAQALALAEESARREPLLSPPEDYPAGGDLLDFYKLLSRKESELEDVRAYLDSFEQTGTPVCNRCGLEQPPGRVGEKKALRGSLEREVSLLGARKQAYEHYRKLTEEEDLWLADYNRRLDRVRMEMSDLPEVSAPSRPYEDLRRLLDDHGLLSSSLNKARVALSRAASQESVLRGKLAAACEARDRKLDLLPGNRLSREEAGAASRRLDEKIALHSQRLRMTYEARALRPSVLADEKQLAKAEGVLSRAVRVREWAGVLQGVRDVLHKDALPKHVSRAYLEGLGGDVNEMLEGLGQTFRVRPDPDLSFEADFVNGTTQPASRLSEGQRSVLAMALRIVVNATFAGDVGLLCLDEPTEGLDRDNMRGLEVALGRLRELSRARGLQCLLITHERSLAPLFDRTLELGPPA